jgi:hypothetical protein
MLLHLLLAFSGCGSTKDTGTDPGDTDKADTGDTDTDTSDTADTDTDTANTDPDSGTDTDTGLDLLFDLEDADILLTGSGTDDVGRSIVAGDFDGDGTSDLLFGTLGADRGAGGAYVTHGPLTAGGTLTDLSVSLRSGTRATQYAGRTIAAGDLDGDGLDDALLGEPYATETIFLATGPIDADRTLDTCAEITGATGSLLGHGFDVADVDGDGQADLVAGAYGDDGGGVINGGAVYVLAGPLDGVASVTRDAVATVWGDRPETAFGRFVRAGGDLDGDGVGDWLVAEPYGQGTAPRAGVVRVFLGGWTGERRAEDADASLLGEDPGDVAGEELAFADVDGDGRHEALVAAYGSAAATLPGAVYVVARPEGDTPLADAAVVVRGPGATSRLGASLAAGDLDADGEIDLLLGATGEGAGGSALLFYGPLAGEIDGATEDVAWVGARPGTAAGESTALVDINADGPLDVLIGANWDAGGAGAVYAFLRE